MVTGPGVHICGGCVEIYVRILDGVSVKDWTLTRAKDVRCGFCGQAASQGVRVIVNPHFTICESCARSARNVVAEVKPSRGPVSKLLMGSSPIVEEHRRRLEEKEKGNSE